VLKKSLGFVVSLAAVLVFMSPSPAYASSQPEQGLAQVEHFVEDALTSANKGQLEQAHTAFEKFHDAWFQVEESVKSQSGQAYSDIESAMGQAEYAFTVNKSGAAIQALQNLQKTNQKFIDGQYTRGSFQKQNMTLDDFILMLQQTKQDARSNRISSAITDMNHVRQSWLNVEGTVVAQSKTVYDDTERDMVTVNAMLQSQPPNVSGAVGLLNQMVTALSPLAGKTGYSMWDAAMIPIREGLEALLVVVALLAFTKKSASNKGKVWVWSGVSAGMIVSAVLAVLVKFVFSSGAFGKNNFLISGWTGVIAAVMLLYMSYWLHSKSQIKDWQNFLRTKTQAALSTGRLLSLGVLAFLAVFREGTETVLFIIGMVSQITVRNLILGLLVGIAVLAVIAVVMLGVGLKLPIKAFFITSSVIVFYLCLKFTGMGIHSLQLAGLVPSTLARGIPSFSFLAVYPSWQSAVPQIILLVAAVGVIVWRRVLQKRQHLAV
jgi:high-affinity iron transporter